MMMPCSLLLFTISIIAHLEAGGSAYQSNSSCSLTASGALSVDECTLETICAEGDVTVALMSNVHLGSNETFWCSDLMERGVELAAAIQWIFEKLNNNNYIKGVHIGSVVLDSCARKELAMYNLVDLLKRHQKPSCSRIDVTGVIGSLSSGQTLAIIDELAKSNIVYVSPTSTAPSLSNTTNHPTFLRTVLPDQNEIKVLMEILLDLRVFYVAVVSSSDAYGEEGSTQFLQLLKDTQICVAKHYVMDTLATDHTYDIVQELVSLGGNTASGYIPVVFIGQYASAKFLIEMAHSARDGKNILWLMPNSVETSDDLFRASKKIGQNVISVSPAYIDVVEFREYWIKTLLTYITDADKIDTWVHRKYIETFLRCSFDVSNMQVVSCRQKTEADIRVNYQQSSFISMAIDAAYIMAKSLKRLHFDYCGQEFGGICNDMRSVMRSKFVQYVKSTSFAYPDDFTFVPNTIREAGYHVRFNNTNDPVLDKRRPSYFVHNYKCSASVPETCDFKKVGTYLDDTLEVNWGEVTLMLGGKPITGTKLRETEIICQRTCLGCNSFKMPIPFAYIPGEFLIVAFFPVYERGSEVFNCGQDMRQGETLEMLEPALYSVEKFNDPNGVYRDNPISGKLGIIVFDSCENPIYTAYTVGNFQTRTIVMQDPIGNIYKPSKVIGYIGGMFSSVNLEIADIIKELNLIQLSYAASSTQLFEYSSHFLRTIPADDMQAQVMIKFIIEMKWNAFMVAYQGDAYGELGFKALKDLAQNNSLCLAKAIKVEPSLTDTRAHDVLQEIYILQAQTNIKAVVLFLSWTNSYRILKVANSLSNKKRVVWIGTESWASRDDFFDNEVSLEALGAITVMARTTPSESLNEYMHKLRPDTNTRDPFFPTWWENKFRCSLPNTDTGQTDFEDVCEPDLDLEGNYIEDARAELVIKTVLSLGKGLGEALPELDNCPMLDNCEAIRTPEGLSKIVNSVKNVQLISEKDGTSARVYTDRGDGLPHYNVLNIQYDEADKTYRYVTIATFEGDFNLTDKVRFYDENKEVISTDQVKSICIDQCGDCKTANDRVNKEISKYAHKEGHVMLLALLPLHQTTADEPPSPEGLKALETLVASVDSINANTTLLPRISLGYHVLDTFSDPEIAAWHMMSIFGPGKHLNLPQYDVDPRRTVVVISGGSSSVSTRMQESSQYHQIFNIDFCTCLRLIQKSSDTNSFFYPLLPSLSSELRIIANVIHHYGFKHVGIIFSESIDGRDANDQMKDYLLENNVCIVKEISLSLTSQAREYKDLAETLLDDKMRGKVIVLLLEQDQISELFENIGLAFYSDNINGENHDLPTYIGGGAFKKGLESVHGIYKSVVNRSIVIDLTMEKATENMLEIMNVLRKIDDDQYRNPWFSEDIWAGAIQGLEQSERDETVNSVVQAVFLVAQALHLLSSEECGPGRGFCDELADNTNTPLKLKHYVELVQDRFPSGTAAPWVNDVSYQVHTLWFKDQVSSYYLELIGQYSKTGDIIRFENNWASEYFTKHRTGCEDEEMCALCDTDGRAVALGVIVGVVIAVLVLVLVAVVMSVILYKRRKQTIDNKEAVLTPPTNVQERDIYLHGGCVYQDSNIDTDSIEIRRVSREDMIKEHDHLNRSLPTPPPVTPSLTQRREVIQLIGLNHQAEGIPGHTGPKSFPDNQTIYYLDGKYITEPNGRYHGQRFFPKRDRHIIETSSSSGVSGSGSQIMFENPSGGSAMFSSPIPSHKSGYTSDAKSDIYPEGSINSGSDYSQREQTLVKDVALTSRPEQSPNLDQKHHAKHTPSTSHIQGHHDGQNSEVSNDAHAPHKLHNQTQEYVFMADLTGFNGGTGSPVYGIAPKTRIDESPGGTKIVPVSSPRPTIVTNSEMIDGEYVNDAYETDS